MSDIVLKCSAYGIIGVFGLIVWTVSTIAFLMVFCIPYWIDNWIYDFRFKELDEYCEKLVAVVRDKCAVEIVGARDPTLVSVYIENHSYVKVLASVSTVHFLVLLATHGITVARHFALTFKDISSDYKGTFYDIYDLGRQVLADIEPGKDYTLIWLYKRVQDIACQQYGVLPGIGLLWSATYNDIFHLVNVEMGAAPICCADKIRFSKKEKLLICDGLNIDWEIVSDESHWQKYRALATRIVNLVA